MAIGSIGANTPSYPLQSFSAIRYQNQQALLVIKATGQMASGDAITKAAYDPSGLAISEKLKAQIAAVNAESDNWEDEINSNLTKEGYLGSIQDMSQRMGELAARSSNGTLADEDRYAIQSEFDQLKSEINRISETANFNNNPLMKNVNTKTLGLDGIDLSSADSAAQAAFQLRITNNGISDGRAQLGAKNNALVSRINNSGVLSENLSLANSRIRDTDYAKTSTFLTSSNVMNNFSNAMIAQGNVQAQHALRLLL